MPNWEELDSDSELNSDSNEGNVAAGNEVADVMEWSYSSADEKSKAVKADCGDWEETKPSKPIKNIPPPTADISSKLCCCRRWTREGKRAIGKARRQNKV